MPVSARSAAGLDCLSTAIGIVRSQFVCRRKDPPSPGLYHASLQVD
jgi:hypothetical protein